MIDGQLTIFDYMEPERPKVDFHDMTEQEMVEYIGKELGLIFHHNDYLRQWEVNYKRHVISLYYSTYFENKELFISAGVDKKYGNYYGQGRPCDSLEETINFLKGAVEKIDANRF